MSTACQRAANRRNAQLSTGPRTPRGRAIVASNPLTHGFYARVPIADLEDPAAYHAVLADYIADLRPAGALEAELVHRYVKDLWKLRRLEQMERLFFIDAMERLEPRVASHITDPAQRASRACFDALETQFNQFKTVAPLERVALLGQRLRRGLDSTLRLLLDLQAQRFASDPGDTPFAELATLPPDPFAYLRVPADVPDHPAAPPSTDPCASDPLVSDPRPQGSGCVVSDPPDSDPPDSDPRPSGSVVLEWSVVIDLRIPDPPVSDPRTSGSVVLERSVVIDLRENDLSLPDPQPPAGVPPAPPDTPPSTPPNSPQTPSASPTIHKPNQEIGFVPSKMQSTPPIRRRSGDGTRACRREVIAEASLVGRRRFGVRLAHAGGKRRELAERAWVPATRSGRSDPFTPPARGDGA